MDRWVGCPPGGLGVMRAGRGGGGSFKPRGNVQQSRAGTWIWHCVVLKLHPVRFEFHAFRSMYTVTLANNGRGPSKTKQSKNRKRNLKHHG